MNSLINLEDFLVEKQYKKFYRNNIDLTKDTVSIHKKHKDNFERYYNAAWIKLLTENSSKQN